MIEGSGRRVADPATRKLRPLDRNRAWRRAAGAALALATAAAWHLMSDDSAARFASFALWALVLAGCLQVGPRHAASILALSLLTALGLDASRCANCVCRTAITWNPEPTGPATGPRERGRIDISHEEASFQTQAPSARRGHDG